MNRDLLDEVMDVPPPCRWTVEAAQARGSDIARSARVAPQVYDLLKLQRAVRTLCVESQGPAAGRALALEAALAPLPKEACAQVAVGVVCALRDEHLRDLARGALLVLRDACSLAPDEAASASLARLDDELERRGPLALHELAGQVLIGDGLSAEVMALAMAQVLQMLAHPVQRKSVEGNTIVVTAMADRDAEDEVILAHLRGCARRTFGCELLPALEQVKADALLRLQAEKVLAAAPPVQTGLRTVMRDTLRHLSGRRAVARVPMALRLSVMSR